MSARNKKEKSDSYYINQILYNSDKKEAFLNIPVKRQGEILTQSSSYLQTEVLKTLKNKEIQNFLTYLDPDQATDLLQKLSNKRRDKITKRLSEEIKEKVDFLLKFNPKTAAGLMDLNYIQVDIKSKFKDVAELIEKHEKRTGSFPTILVVDNGKLLGELPGHSLALYTKKEKVENHIKSILTAKYDLNEKDILKKFKTHPHGKLIVVDEKEATLGVIHADEILKIIERKSNLYSFAGVNKEEDIFDPVKEKVRNRYRWLILNLATAFLAAFVVSIFENTISRVVILAAYLPVIAGMGGNAGTQAMAVMVRGLVTKNIDIKSAKEVLLNEVEAAAINGIINGIIIFFVSYFLTRNLVLGIVLFVSMIVSLITAAFFGSIIPVLMRKTGKDPAASAGIFITTTTDIIGFLTLLGLASILL